MLYLPYKVLIYSQYISIQAILILKQIEETLEEFETENIRNDHPITHRFIENIGDFYSYFIELKEEKTE